MDGLKRLIFSFGLDKVSCLAISLLKTYMPILHAFAHVLHYICQGAIAHPDAFHLAGDVQEYCVQCSMNNFISLNEQRMSQNM